MPKMLRLAATIWKCPDFFSEMSGILVTRIPPFCTSGFKMVNMDQMIQKKGKQS